MMDCLNENKVSVKGKSEEEYRAFIPQTLESSSFLCLQVGDDTGISTRHKHFFLKPRSQGWDSNFEW